MKRTVLFVLLDQFADWEAAYLSSALYLQGQGGYEVKTVSLTKDPVTSIGGFHVMPDYDILSVPEDYDAVILIGAMTWRSEEAKQIKALAESCRQKGKLLGGICGAAGFLGAIGILNHINHTGNSLEDLTNWTDTAYTGESRFIKKQAVIDDLVVTANGSAPLEFAKTILSALQISPTEEIEGWYRYHKDGCFEI